MSSLVIATRYFAVIIGVMCGISPWAEFEITLLSGRRVDFMSAPTANRPYLIGHRGAPGYRPEHTESSYRLAFAQGVDAVEPDLVVTSDGVLVIRHENEISGTTNVAELEQFADRRTTKTVDGVTLTGWFTEDFTWAELSSLKCRERVPELRPENVRFDDEEPMLRLRDLCAIVDEASTQHGREFGLVIELKHVQALAELGHDLVSLLLVELRETGWDAKPGRLVIECFELSPLDRLREAGLPASLVFLLEHSGAPADQIAFHGDAAHEFSWYRTDAGLESLVGVVNGISLAKRDLFKTNALGKVVGANDVVARAHRLGLKVYTWTMRPENRFLAQNFRLGRSPREWGDWKSEWQVILSSGLDGVFLDHPDLLDQVVQAKSPAAAGV